MSMPRNFSLAAVALCCVAACVDTGAEPVVIPLRVAGRSAQVFEGRDAWRVELATAKLAFGPLTLCAGATAAGLCETAHAEWLDSAVVDVLDPKAHRVGDVIGIGGPVRSWMYDLGYVSVLTAEEPINTAAARKLGHSLQLVGSASSGDRTLNFEGDLELRQESATERGVPVVSKSRDEHFEQDLSESGLELLVRFDPEPWFAQVDFESAYLDLGCEGTCEFAINSDTQAYRALRIAIEAGQHPQFTWQQR
jgi:hypothetical protein